MDRTGSVLSFVAAAGDRRDLPPAQEAGARLRRPPGLGPGGVLAADCALEDASFRADAAVPGFTPDIPRDPRSEHRPKERRLAPGRWVAERAPAHFGCAFRAIRTRRGRLHGSFEVLLATVVAQRTSSRVGS